MDQVYSKYSYFILLFIFLFLLLLSFSSQFGKIPDTSVTVGVILFIIFGGLIILSSINRPSSLRWVLSPVGWTLLWFLVIVTGINFIDMSPKFYTSILRWFVIRYAFISLVVALLAAVITEVSIGPIKIIQYPDYPRLAGWYVNPNGLAPVLVTGVLCTISAGINELNKRGKVLYYSLAILFGLGVVLTGSRGPVGALIISLFIYGMVSFRSKSKKLKLHHYMIGACVLFGGALTLVFLLTWIDLFQRSDPFSRFEIWQGTTSIIRTASTPELLFGHGHRYFIEVTGSSPHSDYIRFLVNYGLLSIITLASIAAVTIRSILRYLRHEHTRRGFDIGLFSSLLVYISIYMIYGQATFQVKFSSFIFVAAIAPLLAYGNPIIKLQHFSKNNSASSVE
ncbi:O-antigen ligase family protein [Natrinema pallidum]|uniref:O-antigen ligase family protein n=1 Tax=Natrinema pallidum TaxID=69527 RepID=UPI001268ECFA|nr:O-antigen ligase family protein [Natrinema pallidum]